MIYYLNPRNHAAVTKTNYFMTTNKLTIGLVLSLALLTYGCKPVKVLDVREIRPNETAWAIPLDGSSKEGQVKFNSVGFLDQKKVAAKRIMIDKVERTIGRFYWDIEWIPTVRVIAVDRSLVTREWTDTENRGTSGKDEGIAVVTRDSVGLTVGLTVTASIDEDDASTYLYYHGEKLLSQVVDENVRSFAVAELTKQYSELSLTEAQTHGTAIYQKLFEDAKAMFKTKGITIQYLGNAEGLTYKDPKVQESINKRYIVEQDTKTAEMEQNAQKIRNQTTILTAQAQAEAAQKMFAAREASLFNNDLQIRMKIADAQLNMSTKWDGSLPKNILPSNSPLLLNLGTASSQ